MPLNGQVRVQVTRAEATAPQRLLLRIPAWTDGRFALKVNGRKASSTLQDGYALLERRWKAGDVVELELATPLRLEHAAGDTDTVVVMRGPLALAADLGPVSVPWDAPDPALVADASPLGGFTALPQPGRYLASTTRPQALEFSPFHAQHDRRSALYFRRMDAAQWVAEAQRREQAIAERAQLQADAVDMIQFGNEASEKAHGLTSDTSFAAAYRRQECRDVRGKGFVEFVMQGSPQPLALRLRFWGSDKGRFNILVNGALAVEVEVERGQVLDFVDHVYALPHALTREGQPLRFRFEPQHGDTARPLFGGCLVPV